MPAGRSRRNPPRRIFEGLDRQAVLGGQRLERDRRAGADMLDHFGSRQRAEAGGGAVVLAARQPDQETGGEQIAGAGDVDHAVDRHRLHRLDRLAGDHHAAFLAARDHRELGVVTQRLDRGVEVGGLIETVQLVLVGENNVDGALADQRRGIRRGSDRRRTHPTA